ncbi:MAG TPA: MFS transporter [Hyphomicrobiaceae bacterium]|nr:MFS transporter [Hyphomicrobiaceae bacterium]
MTTAANDDAFSLTGSPGLFALWQSRFLSGTAVQMLFVAIGWQLYELTANPLDLGLVGLVQFVPLFLASPLAGYAADTRDRRRVALVCQSVAAIIALLLTLSALSGQIGRYQIFLLVGLLGLLRAFEFPTLSALVPLLVTRDQMTRAVSHYSSANQASIVLGPAVGGILTMAGPAVAYGVATALLAAAAWRTSTLRPAPQNLNTSPFSVTTLLAGGKFIISTPVILGALSLDLVAVLLGAVVALLPIVAKDILQVGPWGLGILRASPAVGALSMAIYLAHNPLRSAAGAKMFWGVAIYGVATIVFGFAGSFLVAILALLVMGAADVISVVVRQSLVQLRTPDDMRGRVGAVNTMFIAGSNQLGDFRAGLVAAAIGTGPAILVGGVCAVAIAAVWAALFPSLRKLDRLEN